MPRPRVAVRMAVVGLAALVIGAGLLAYQYFFVFLGLLGYAPPELPLPATTGVAATNVGRASWPSRPRGTCSRRGWRPRSCSPLPGSVILDPPVLVWALVSSFGFLLARTLSG